MYKFLLTVMLAVAFITSAAAETITRAYAIRMWASNVEGNEPALVSFDLNNPSVIREEFSLSGHYFRAAVCIDRNYYLIDCDDQMVPYRLLKLNIDTHKLETITEYGTSSFEGGLIFQDMTYDASTGNVYALAFDIDSGTLTDDQELDVPLGLFSFDVTTGTATRIKIYDSETNLLTLSASPDGYLYAISAQGQLWDIQKSSGRLGDIICETGLFPVTVQSAEFNPLNGVLYWAGFYATADQAGNPVPNGFLGSFTFGDDMVSFDRLANMPHNEELVGLYIDPNPIDRNAPSEVQNFVAAADASGAQQAVLSWVNPALNAGGDNLTECITVSIFRNDALIATLTDLTPGSNGSYTDAVGANCSATYHIIASNAAGNGRAVYAPAVFVGHDLPAEVQNLKAQRTGTGYDIAVSWSAPIAGINGGWLDSSSFTYDVVRYPDAKVIASATTATSLTDNSITEPAGYYYAVTASNADGKGVETLSNTVVSGSALEVPYHCDFSTPEMARQWTVVDADHDGQTFYRETTSANGEWFMKFFPDRELGPDIPADDWLISSLIHLEAGATYAFRYQVRTLGSLFPLNFDVTLGTATTAESQQRVLNSYTDFGYEMTWYYNTELVTVDATGDYSLAFHVKNAVSASFSFIHVEKLSATDLQAIELTGNTTPSLNSPADYTVTVKNLGYTATTGYTVKLVDENGVVLTSVQPAEAIEPQATAPIALSWTPTTEGKYSIKAVVEIAGDTDLSNNTSSQLNVDVISGGQWIDLTFYNREIGYTPVDLRSNYSMTQTIY
ncbi:MAG: choice-of-anchor J domain-containing protein, partial [Muribaculaceae bacterium]